MKVKKGIILAAGKGTRLRPLTTSIPKAMLPVVNKPVIDYIIEEALASGLTEIAVVCNYQKEVLYHYLKHRPYIHFIEQPNFGGTALALKSAIDFIDGEDFSLFLGDEIVTSLSTPCMAQLLSVFYHYQQQKVITGIESVSKELLKEYNVLSIDRTEVSRIAFIKDIIEKPTTDSELHSSYTSIGRYVIPHTITPYLSDLEVDAASEIPLTSYFKKLTTTEEFIGYYFDGKRYDIGSIDKWMNTNIQLHKK